MNWLLSFEADGTHVLPINDLREHNHSRHCWCKPLEEELSIWVHNSMDQREQYEEGRKLQ